MSISIDETVYNGLVAFVGRDRISAFLERLVRPLVVPGHFEIAYAELAGDPQREAKADEWTESLLPPEAHETW